MARTAFAAAAVLLGSAHRSEASVPNVKLSDGVDMPVLAFAAQVWDANTCKNATAEALKMGFRFIWSSVLVGSSCQAAQREAIAASGIARSELFIAGTVDTQRCQDADSCYMQSAADAKAQFDVLGVDVLDMLMLDYPSSAGCPGIAGQWKALEEVYAAKKVRTIAVSNFDPDQLACVAAHKQVMLPTVNQMQYSVGHGSDTVVADDAKYGVVVQAYSPLGSGGLATDPLCTSIGKTYGKSAVQVALRWILQRNVTIATQSTNPAHLQEDLDIFDFTLSDEDMAKLNARNAALMVM